MEDYTAWVDEKKIAQAASKNTSNIVLNMEELMTKGEAVYKAQCLVCHQANGEGLKGAFPAIVGSPVAVEKGNRIRDMFIQIIYGKGLMPAFGEQLSDVDIASIVSFTREMLGEIILEILFKQKKLLRQEKRQR